MLQLAKWHSMIADPRDASNLNVEMSGGRESLGNTARHLPEIDSIDAATLS